MHDKLQNFPKVLQHIEMVFDKGRDDCILRCDIVSISQLEGSLEYQFAVLGMIPKKITFLVILWFGISDLLDFEIIGEEASIDVMRWRWDGLRKFEQWNFCMSPFDFTLPWGYPKATKDLSWDSYECQQDALQDHRVGASKVQTRDDVLYLKTWSENSIIIVMK